MPSPTPQRARRSHAERSRETQDHLIDTAIGVIRDKSFQGATIFEIAKSAGMTPGALQHHFSSKAVLMMRVVDRLTELGAASGGIWPDASGPLPERAEALVRTAWERIYEPSRFLAAWNVYFGCSTDEAVRAYIADKRLALQQGLRTRFHASFPELAGRPGADAFIDMVFTTLRGLGLLRLFGPQAAECEAQLGALVQTIVQRCQAD
jgi:AcrR family transcriptional regulator